MFSRIKGVVDETVLTLMLKSLPEEEYIVLNNVILPTDEGDAQIDHIVLSLYGIFVIKVKNVQGQVTGSDSSKKWSQDIYGKKSRFQNPIHQNKNHIKALGKRLRLPDKYFIPMVVFSAKTDLQVNTNYLVLDTTQVKSTIQEFKKERLMRLEIERYKKTISQGNITSLNVRRTFE